MIREKSSVCARTAIIFSCLMFLGTAHAQSDKKKPDDDAIWAKLSGHWVRYAGDNIIHKVVSAGQEKHFGTSQYGTLRFEFVNPMLLTEEGGIHYFTKLNPKTKEPVYKGAFKVHQGRFFEFSRGLFSDSNRAPVMWTFVPLANPVFQLHVASREGDTKGIQKALDSGVPVDATMWSSYTPLAYAAAGGHLDSVKLLLERGAQVNKKARFAKTALNHAIGGGSIEACELLIKNGADLEAQNANNGNLLHEAAFWGQPPKSLKTRFVFLTSHFALKRTK